MNLRDYIVDVYDWPRKGIVFRDITPLLATSTAYHCALGHLANCVASMCSTHEVFAAIESRGFLFGAPLAVSQAKSFIPIRKAGKLPRPAHQEAYNLEYGTSQLEIHQDALKSGQKVILVDDVLATGGTAGAAVRLLQKLGAEVIGCVFLIELPALEGRKALGDIPVAGVIQL